MLDLYNQLYFNFFRLVVFFLLVIEGKLLFQSNPIVYNYFYKIFTQMKRFLRKIRVKHVVTPINVEPVIKPKSFVLSPSQIVAKKLAFEMCGLQPYERKAVDYIKNDNVKKARKFLKKKLGSLVRGEKKLDVLMKVARN